MKYQAGAVQYAWMWCPTLTVEGAELPLLSATLYADRDDAILHAVRWADRMEHLEAQEAAA